MAEEERSAPRDPLDYQMQVTNPDYGRNLPPELKEAMTEKILLTDKEGRPVLDPNGNHQYIITEKWHELANTSRDLRLGNIGMIEKDIIEQYFDFADMCLAQGYYESYIRATTIGRNKLELSQSRKGWLREMLATIIKRETRDETYSQKKKPIGGLFGGGQPQ